VVTARRSARLVGLRGTLGDKKYQEPTVPATVACTTALMHCEVHTKASANSTITVISPLSWDVYDTAAVQTKIQPSCTASAPTAT